MTYGRKCRIIVDLSIFVKSFPQAIASMQQLLLKMLYHKFRPIFFVCVFLHVAGIFFIRVVAHNATVLYHLAGLWPKFRRFSMES